MKAINKKWTDEQLLAINSDGKGIVVSAAAGSGKTTVLINRTIRLLTDTVNKIPADTLLAVTFTNAAAAQLRNKLADTLSQKLAQQPDNEWLMSQQSRLQMAKIMTINAFCLELVRNNAHALGLQSGVRIIEENDSIILENDMLDKAIDEYYALHQSDMKLLNDKMCRNKEDIANAARSMRRYLRSIPFSEQTMTGFLNRLCSEDDVMSYCKDILDHTSRRCSEAIVISEKCRELCVKLNVDYGIEENIELESGFLKDLKQYADNNNWDGAYALISGYSTPTIKQKISLKEEAKYEGAELQLDEDRETVAYISSERGKIKDIIVKDISEKICCPFGEIMKDCEYSKKLAEIIYGIVKRTEELMTEEKQSRNVCDFADVELMTVSLLAEMKDGAVCRTPLCEEIVRSKEYGVILIDEFQDINDLQDIIFKCLSDTDDLDIFGKNVFVVGDIKQSIYRFRLSDPKLFLEARENCHKEKYSSKLEELALTMNFRSRKNIIDFTNFLFARLMSESVGDVVYNDSEKLNFGAPYNDVQYPTELIVCGGDDAEYSAAAAKIRQMLDDKVSVYENGELRPCRPDDFCILTRTKSHNSTIFSALEKYGLKMSCKEVDGYLKSREISLMTSLLKVIDDPMNDTAMLSVMLSPIMRFSDDDAALLKINSGKLRGKRLYTLICAAADGDIEIPNALKEKCAEAADRIKQYRRYASAVPIEKLIRKLYTETDLYILSAAFSGGERAQANLRLLLEIASGYDSSSEGGLTGFIRFFDCITESGNDFLQASTVTEAGNAVQVMTMHKSKGLEFPFVFLCNLSRNFKFDDKDSLLINKKGVGIMFTDSELLARYPTAAHTAIAMEERAGTLSEELRLLYVAVTRAKERLFIMLPEPNKNSSGRLNDILYRAASAGGLTPDIVSSADSMLDWIVAACAFHADCSALEELMDTDFYNISPTDRSCAIQVTAASDTAAPDKTSQRGEPVSVDREAVSRMAERFSLPPIDVSEQMAKLSVSEIVHGADKKRIAICPQIPAVSSDSKRPTAAKRGTLTHRFMELCELKNAEKSVSDELDRLTAGGRFTAEEAECIYRGALERFFSGAFARRMLASGNIIREKQFMVKLCDLGLPHEIFGALADSEGMVQGVVDCVFEENGGYVLVDYKTDRVDTLEQLAERYGVQLLLYKAALSLILDKPVTECLIYSLYLGDGITV